MPKKLQVKLEELSEEDSDSSDEGIVFEAPPAIKEKPIKKDKPVKKVTIKEEPTIHEEPTIYEKPTIHEESRKDVIWCAKCRDKTESKEMVEVEVKGKSEGKKRNSVKCKCNICGTSKTSFKAKPK